jgi:hypothetical protein
MVGKGLQALCEYIPRAYSMIAFQVDALLISFGVPPDLPNHPSPHTAAQVAAPVLQDACKTKLNPLRQSAPKTAGAWSYTCSGTSR